MFKHRSLAIALAGALALPGIALAEQPVHNVIGEAGIVFHDPPSVLTRQQVQDARRETQSNTLAADGWRYVGGEAGWIRESHRMTFQNGRLVHARDCPLAPQDAARASTISTPNQFHSSLYQGS